MADRLEFRALIVGAFLLTWLVTPVAVGATHHGEGVPDQVELQMTYQQPSAEGAHAHLIANATIDDGSPAVGVDVEFLREVDFLGPRLISLGSAITDSNGTARVTIDTQESTILVRARSQGNDLYLPAEVTSEIHQPVSAEGPRTGNGEGGSEPSLVIVAAVMPPVLAAIALVIWLSLLGLAAATVLGIRRNRAVPIAAHQERNGS